MYTTLVVDLTRWPHEQGGPQACCACLDEAALAALEREPIEGARIIDIRGWSIRYSPLALLDQIVGRLPPSGLVMLRLDSAQTNCSPTVMDLLYALAQRCGFAKCGSDRPRRVMHLRQSSLCLERCPQPPRWRLTHLGPDDFGAFAGLFRKVFGHTISRDLWSWKYSNGRGCGVAALRSGQLIAHYAGTLRRVVIFGREGKALQICDAMVDPRERAVMTKTGAMYQVTATFLEVYLGLAGIPLAFGFPNQRAMGLGVRLGLYAEVGKMKEVRWSALSARPRLRSRLSPLVPGRLEDRAAVNTLWSAMRRDLQDAVIVVRDWDYLTFRYFEHPEHRYEVLLMTSRISGEPIGVLVLRVQATEVELLDLVAPLSRLADVVDQARRCAGLWSRETLYCWITQQHVRRLAGNSGRITDLDIHIPTNAWVRQDLTVAQLQDRWWLTSGDTDFH